MHCGKWLLFSPCLCLKTWLTSDNTFIFLFYPVDLSHLVYSHTLISPGNTHRDTHKNNAFPVSKYPFCLPWCNNGAHIENTILASRDSFYGSSGAVCRFLSAGITVCGISACRISTFGVLNFQDCKFGDFKP